MVYFDFINDENCNNPPIESTLDPPYVEIQEIYGKQETDAKRK